MNSPTLRLAEILEERLADVLERERTAFDRLADGKPVVLLGKGHFGRKMARHLIDAGTPPLCFAIDFPELEFGGNWEGVPILSTADAVARYAGSAVFVVTYYTPVGGRYDVAKARLSALGCTSIASFVHYAWKHPDRFFSYYFLDAPHFLYEQAGDVAACLALWADEASAREYVAQIGWRGRFEFEWLDFPNTPAVNYFPPDIVSLTESEVIIDCGGYDGDTVRDLVAIAGDRFGKMIVFEADQQNFGRLKHFVETQSAPTVVAKIDLHDAAVGRESVTARFINAGYDGSSLADTRSVSPDLDMKDELGKAAASVVEVPCVALDDALANEKPTFIKMDIEGAELDALEGARMTIARHRPILAISAYHKQNHLWEIPLRIAGMTENYSFFLRRYNESLWDTVVYAVPQERLPLRKA